MDTNTFGSPTLAAPPPETLPTVAPALSVEHVIARVLLADAITAAASSQQDPTNAALQGAADLAVESLTEAVTAAAITLRLDK